MMLLVIPLVFCVVMLLVGAVIFYRDGRID